MNNKHEKIETLIIIPARCGSKGLENKNIKPLAGKPLLAWTIECALRADVPGSLTIVSTDSPEYADIARQFGAETPFIRPQSFAEDHSSALDVIEHALTWFEQTSHVLPSRVMWLQPTSPLRSVANITDAVKLLQENRADSVIGCKAIERDLTALFTLQSGYLRALDSKPQTQTRRQDISALLTPNGAMYLARTELLRQRRSFYGDKTLPLLMNALQSIDIDTLLDWQIAEACIKQGLMDGD